MSETLFLIQVAKRAMKQQASVMSNLDRRRLRITCVLLVSLLIFSAAKAFAVTDCTFITHGKTMRLKADCTTDATITIPQDFTLDGAGHTITAIDPVVGHFLGSVVRNAGTRANVFNLTIKAQDLHDQAFPCDFGEGISGADRLRGIAFYGASGFITHNRILGLNQGMGSVCQEGTGILVENYPPFSPITTTQQVTILDNEIVDAQTIGIAAQGDVFAFVSGNRIGLSDEVGGVTQFGIALSYGAKGTAVLNKVQGGFTDGKGFRTEGVHIIEASNLTVAGNSFSGIQEGIFVESQCFNGPVANNNRIQANLITGAREGIVLVARSTGVSKCDPHVDRNIVGFNVIKSAPTTAPLAGIFYGRELLGGNFTAVANENIIKSNVIAGGYIDPLFDRNSTNTVVSGNVIKP